MTLNNIDKLGFATALAEARKGSREGGVPIGAALVYHASSAEADCVVLGSAHNQRIQKSAPTLHAEIATIEDAGQLSADVYEKSTLYTTLSPCSMCAGAILFYKIPRVVIGENASASTGEEEWLRSRGVEVILVNNEECKELMRNFIENKPEAWNNGSSS
ncbi:hypothetical protein HYDPIDRAFT_114128 [Hydnomerulius pinastri MD-312]|uniref:Cytosine deaminase n=1 Tax=Hydnomerulius pinastri MD-312 TaxID=994086 RepID=A0A0C9VXK5_9AGAM|nr:hypothetical protein HYDPIDRAFT_114128 [Hydnomerulius pinastri MD-312]